MYGRVILGKTSWKLWLLLVTMISLSRYESIVYFPLNHCLTFSCIVRYGEYPPAAVTERFQILTIRLEHSPIFVGGLYAISRGIFCLNILTDLVFIISSTGRYLKLSRDISQTPWVVSGSRLTEKSVSECIGEILREKYRCDGRIS